jgi:hypothetical protein
MRPLKPIKQAQHNNKYAEDKKHIPGRLYVSEPEYSGRKLRPLVVETFEESIARANQTPEPKELARFGKLRFRSESLVLISNDGWKGHSLDVSLRLAHHFAYAERRKTLYMNSIVRADALSRKFKDLVGSSHKSNGLLHLSTAMHGAVGEGLRSLIEAIVKERIEVIVLNSWEWGAFTAKERNQLFLTIDELCENTNVCIIIFTCAKAKSLSPGNYRSGKLGLLSYTADMHIDLRTENELLPALYGGGLKAPDDEVKPIYMTTEKEKKDESKHIGSIEINDLGEVVGTSSVSEGHLVPA